MGPVQRKPDNDGFDQLRREQEKAKEEVKVNLFYYTHILQHPAINNTATVDIHSCHCLHLRPGSLRRAVLEPLSTLGSLQILEGSCRLLV